MKWIKQKIKNLYKHLKNVRMWQHIVLESKTDFKVPFWTKIKYALKTFTPNEYIWYKLKENDYKEYISDFERIKSREINEEYKIILDNKLLFEEIFRNYVKVPENYAWVSDKNIYGLHKNNINNDNIITFLKNNKVSVLKWERGYEGKGTFVIEFKDNKFIINGEQKTEEEVKILFDNCSKAILTEYMTQSKFGQELYPHSANTIRIVCAKKAGERNCHIIDAVQRIGNEYSKPVDNFCAGGFVSCIDIETGALGSIVAKYGEMERRMVEFDCHPDTNLPIKGKVIPNWAEIKKEVEDLTNKFPYLNFVAWDVLLTEKGICIIEGNASSSCDLFQMRQGVRNKELGEIYKSYNIIK